MTQPVSSRAGRRSSAFTLTELAVVIAIIVLILAMAVPAFNYITGSRSIDSAQNILSAMIGRVRSEAIGLQKMTGVFFYIDPTTGRVNVAEVTEAAGTAFGNVEVFLNLMADRDSVALPTGIGLQVLDDAYVVGSNRIDDGYLGYNTRNYLIGVSTTTPATAPYGGVILFDSVGRVVVRRYGFVGREPNSSGVLVTSKILTLLFLTPMPASPPPMSPDGMVKSDATPFQTSIGFVLYEKRPFADQGFNDADPQIDPQAHTSGSYTTDTPSELTEEQWLDQNATPILVNRYNGRLIRGE